MALNNPTLQKIVDGQKAKLPKGEKQEFFERVMVAGLKIMFDEDTGIVDQRIQAADSPEHGIGAGVVDLLGLIFQRSRNTMPWDVGTLAGFALVAEVMDYAEQKGMVQVTTETIDACMQVYIETLMEKMGAGNDKMAQLMQDPQVQEEMSKQGGAAGGAAAVPADEQGLLGGAQ